MPKITREQTELPCPNPDHDAPVLLEVAGDWHGAEAGGSDATGDELQHRTLECPACSYQAQQGREVPA